MGALLGIIGGIVGGAIGAGAWGLIAYLTGYEIGWVAVGVGFVTGLGVAIGSKGRGGVMGGILAAIISLVAVAGGKFFAVEVAAQKYTKSSEFKNELASIEITDDMMVMYVADLVVADKTSRNETISWPTGVTADTAEEEKDYPPELWKDAKARWVALDDATKEQYRMDVRRSIEQAATAMVNTLGAAEVFVQSFSFFDLLWAFLAVGAAFKVGSGAASSDD
ncbi:MAG: hypothetical protein HUU19_05170 [Phycisphaerales bacterium]|jgi:hypothetical protein|nr:hypothetical protein [Phycisphaerales bacterium]